MMNHFEQPLVNRRWHQGIAGSDSTSRLHNGQLECNARTELQARVKNGITGHGAGIIVFAWARWRNSHRFINRGARLESCSPDRRAWPVGLLARKMQPATAQVT